MTTMTSFTFTETLEMTTISCGECGIVFGVPEVWRKERKEDGQGFYCPNGHPRAYRESDIAREKRLRLAAERKQANAEENARIAAIEAGRAVRALKRAEKRAAAGTCQVCHRTIQQMSRHMRTKHPEVVEAAKG